MPDSSLPGDSTVPSTIIPRASLIQTQLFHLPPTTIGSGADALNYTPGSPAWHCAFSRNGEFLAACFGSPDPCIRIWKLTEDHQWVLQTTLQGVHERTIRTIAFAPLASPTVLAAGSFDGTVSIWEYNEKTSNQWECTTQLEGHDNEVKCVVWNSTGSLLATCGRDKTVWLWESFLSGSVGGGDGGDFECIAVLNGHEGDVKCVAFAASHGQWGDGDEILISGSYDDTIKIWAEDAGDWYCAMSIPDIQEDTIWSLAVSPGSGRLVSGSADGSMAIFKSYTEKEKKALFPEEGSGSTGLWKCVGKLPGAHSSTVYSIHYAPARAGHGRIVSGGGDNRIQVYREVMGSTSDQPLFSLDAAVETTHGDVNCVCWHPWDGSIVCSAGDDGTVRLWQYKSS